MIGSKVGGSGVLCPQRPQRQEPTHFLGYQREAVRCHLARRHGADRRGNAAPLAGGSLVARRPAFVPRPVGPAALGNALDADDRDLAIHEAGHARALGADFVSVENDVDTGNGTTRSRRWPACAT